MDIVELILETDRVLERADIRHAFGGALALAYYAEPRSTLDVDLNVFLPPTQLDSVIDLLGELDLRPEQPAGEWIPIAGVRLRAGEGSARLDLFASLDDRYDEIAARCRTFPFGSAGAELPFLGPEDLVLFKLSFGRDKDWVDLAAMAAAGTMVDLDVVEDLLVALRGPALYPRLARARAVFDQ